MKKLICIVCLVMMVSGCMTMNYGIGSEEIDPQKIATIETGNTTKAQILELFGNPHSISTTALGQEVYKYIYMKTQTKTNPLPLLIKMDVNTQYQELNVIFKDDIVIDYTSTRR